MGTEAIRDIRRHSGYMGYAERMLGIPVTFESPAAIDRCVIEQFGGNWREFEQAAAEFLSDGFGVAG